MPEASSPVPEGTLNRRCLAVGVAALALPWGGAALVSWYTWNSAGDFWAAFGRAVPGALRSADDRLFLQDAIAVSVAFAAVVGIVVFLARRRPEDAVAASWILAAVGALLWIGPVGAVPQTKDADMACAATRGAEGSDVRGWSWTRFGTVVVITGAGPAREVTCR